MIKTHIVSFLPRNMRAGGGLPDTASVEEAVSRQRNSRLGAPPLIAGALVLH